MTYFCWRQKQRILDEDNLNLTLFEPVFVPLLPLACVSLVRFRLQTFLLESLRVLLGLLRSRLCWGVIVCIWALPNLILRALCSPSRSGEYRVRECLVGLIDGSAAPSIDAACLVNVYAAHLLIRPFRCMLDLRVLLVVQED